MTPNEAPGYATTSPRAGQGNTTTSTWPPPTSVTVHEKYERICAPKSIVTLYDGQGWLALGYASWDELCDTEFAVRIALPREQRREIVADLADAGMSTRAIAAAVGVSHQTVANDLPPVKNLTPAHVNIDTGEITEQDVAAGLVEFTATTNKIMGRDGKNYTRPEPRAAARAALAEITAPSADIEFRRNFGKVFHAAQLVTTYPPERVIECVEEDLLYLIEKLPAAVIAWEAEIKALRGRGLRVCEGCQVKFSDMDDDAKAEIAQAVLDSYQTSAGTVRSHQSALVEFAGILDDAEQAHRDWVYDLRGQWLRDGMRRFLQERWKSCGDSFAVVDSSGKIHARDGVRGAQRVSVDTGKPQWTQLDLLDWGVDDLRLALDITATQVNEGRINIGMYRRLLDLLEQTCAKTVHDALDLVGKTLEEFLNANEVAS